MSRATPGRTVIGFARVLLPAALAIVVFVVAAGTPAPVRGAIRTWDGGGADNNWNTPANWSSDAVPGAMDRAVFDGTSTKDATINLNVSVQGMQIDVGYTGTITQAAGSTLTVGVADFSQAAGTFVGGTAAITINNAFTLSGGSFTSTTGTLTITGAVTKSGGVFAHNSGTVAFSTSNVTINVGGTETFNNVSFLSGTKTIAAGNTLVVTGTLNLAGGGLSTGTLAAQGNINAQIGFTGGGSATLLINGTGAQTFTGFHTSATGSLPNVDINKPAGTLTIAGTLRTARNWTYTAGSLDPGTSTLVFNGTPTITGSHTLNAVEIRGGTITIAAGTTLTATGSLNLFSGGLSTGTLAAQGNINAQIGFTGGGSATLLINGTGAQTFTGFHTSATGSLPNVDINKPAGTLTIAGTLRTARNWTYTSGGLNATGSTLIFNGTQTITGSHTLDAVEIRGGTITIAAGTTLTATGNVTLFSGSFGGTGTLAAHANIDAASGFTGGTATLLINGSGAQLLSQAAIATSSLPVVNIAKPSGTLTMSGTFRTNRNWTYTSGGLNAAGTSILFAGTLTITGTHTLNAVEIAGTVTIAAGTTLTAAGNLTLTSGSLSTGTLAAQADISATVGYTGGGSATLLINGAGAQTLTGFHTTTAGSMPNVDIAKPSGTLTIAGTIRTARNWTYTSGGLTATGSTLIFNGTQTITGSHTLNAVEIRGGTITIAAGTTLTVTGPLNLFSGSFGGTGTLAAHANIDAASGFTGGTATLLINGSGAQTLQGFHTALLGGIPNVVIDKPSGTLFLVGTIRVLTSSWTWLQGVVDPGTSTVYFDTTVTISGTHSLYNVYLSGGAHTVTGGDTLTALGTLTLDNGTIDGGTIAAAGPLTQLSTFDGGSGLLRVVGTGNQTFDGFATIGSGDLPAFEIDKALGILTLTGTIRTTNNWTYLTGTVDPDASLLVFAGTNTVAAAGMTFNDLTVNGGTTTLAEDLNVLGDLLVAAGTLNGAGMTITVGGDVTVDGTFTPGTGLLVMNGVVPQTLGGAAASIGLHDFTVNNAAGVTITTAVSVAGTLTLNGPLDISGQTLGIANPIAGTPTNLTGDPLSSLVVAGTGAGIVIPSSLPALANLTLDNPNGAALAGPLTIGSLLTLTNGVLDAGAWVVVIDPAASVARTSGHVSGALQKTIPLGAGVAVTFEIGDATTYAPVSLLFGTVSGSGTITAFTVPGEHPNIGSSVIDPAQDVNRWWSLVNGDTVFDSVQATFTWDPTDVDPGAQTSAFVVAKWDGAWVLPVTGASLPTSITAFGMTSLSEFAVGEVESADLPDTAQGVAVPAAAVFAASLLAALTVLAGLAVPSMRARHPTAPVVASPRAEWETFWQELFR